MDVPSDYMSRFKLTPKAEEHKELCKELEPFYGKVIWSLPHKAGFSEQKIREAHAVCVRRGIHTIGYLIGVIKRLK